MSANNTITVNLDHCKKITDPTAILLFALLSKLQTSKDKGVKMKQVELAEYFNTSVYKIKTAVEHLISINFITSKQTKSLEETGRGVSSYIYRVIV